MKMAESGKNVMASCIIYFDNIQVSLSLFSLSSNAYKVMMAFFKSWPENITKASITLQELRLKLNKLNETCTSSKSIMQLTKTIFSDSANFNEKRAIENRLLAFL